ncbi:MAG: hypothetical protein C0436_04335 [Alphaproteobacteria bacterium]|nr:hypothetical protein [Alphaproteobacteria bacterium]
MRRTLLWLLIIAGLSAAGLFLADMRGMVQLEWLGYRITLRTSLLVALVGIGFLLCTWLVLLVAQLWEMPARRRLEKQHTRHKNGLHALTLAATAMAMSDAERARKEIKRAQRYLDHSPLTLLMEAQWYEKQGASDKALPLYQELAMHEDTAQLGLRGLLQTAERKGDYAHALSIAQEAALQFPKDGSLFVRTIELMLREGKADEAIALLSAWRMRWRLNRDARLHYLALSYTVKALTLPVEERVQWLEKAHAMRPEHPYIPLALLASYGATEHSHTRSLLQRVWNERPSPALTAFSLQWLNEQPDEKRAKLVRKLTRYAHEHLEAYILTAYDAEARSQLAEAHDALESAIAIRESRRALTLMAEIESELIGADKAQWWFARAAAAPSEEQWVCQSCGHASPEWDIFCPRCNSLDSHNIALPSQAVTSIEIVKSP